MIAVADEFCPFSTIEEVDERVAEDTIILFIIKWHIGHGTMVDGHVRAVVLTGHIDSGLRDLYTGNGHTVVFKTLCVPAIAKTGNQDVLYPFFKKEVAGKDSGVSRFESPHFLFFIEGVFPEFSFHVSKVVVIFVGMADNNIPIHTLTTSPLLVFPVQGTCDDSFDGLHRHDFVEVIWFTKAAARVEIDFVPYQVGNDSLCMILPGQVFRMVLGKQQGYVMAFSKELFDELTGNKPMHAMDRAPKKLDNAVLRAIKALIPLIVEEYEGQKRMPLLKAYLSAFIYHVTDGGQGVQRDSRVNELLELIEVNYLMEREAGFYAEQLHVSLKYLNALVKKARGVTVKELIIQRVVLEAKREINYGQLSFKEIAFKLGFNDPAYFSRFFKTQTGVSPEGFAKG